MNGEKKTLNRYYILLFVFAAAFSGIAFAAPFRRGAVFWLAYFFEILAVVLQIPLFRLAFTERDTLRSRFLGFPVFRVGYIYLGLQTVTSFALFVLGKSEDFPVWVSSVVCIVLLCGAVLCGITSDVAADYAGRIESSEKQATAFITELKMLTSGLAALTNDTELKNAVSGLDEDIRFSDPVSSAASAEAEEKLKSAVKELSEKIKAGTASVQDVTAVKTLLAERNNLVKISK